MALTYADKVNASQTIKDKFTEIKDFKLQIKQAVLDGDEEQYKYLVNVVYGKISVVEITLNNLNKKLKALDA